jgi:hypothetical protein
MSRTTSPATDVVGHDDTAGLMGWCHGEISLVLDEGEKNLVRTGGESSLFVLIISMWVRRVDNDGLKLSGNVIRAF